MACNDGAGEPLSSLKGTQWKLVSFSVEPLQSQCETCFTLIFNEDSTLSGFSSANLLAGTYMMNAKDTTRILLTIHTATFVYEQSNGTQYIEALNAVQFFSIYKDTLILYYNNKKNYLLFKPFKNYKS